MSEENSLAGVSLMDLAGIDMGDLEARRIGDVLPKQLSEFECTEADLSELKDGDTTTGFMAKFKWKVLGVIAKVDSFDESEMVGKVHEEVRFIKNKEGLEFLKGYLLDCGAAERGSLGDLVKSLITKKVRAQITHRKDKNDSDKIYSGMMKVKALS